MLTRNVENNDHDWRLATGTITRAFENATRVLRLIAPIDKPKSATKLVKSEKSKNSTKNSTMKPDLDPARSVDAELSRTSR